MAIENHVKQDSWKKQPFEDCLMNDRYQCIGLFDQDQLLGYAILMKIIDEAELLNICIDKKFQGKGLGKKLLEFSIKTLKTQKIFLEVRKSNIAAIKFYEQFGFVQMSKRKNYYKNPTEDALIMQKETI